MKNLREACATILMTLRGPPEERVKNMEETFANFLQEKVEATVKEFPICDKAFEHFLESLK